MKVAFDSQIFTMQEYGGISRYICNLAAQLSTIDGVETKIFSPFYINFFLDKLPRKIVSGVRIPRIPGTGRTFHRSGLWLARHAIARFAPQIVHETYYAANPLASRSARTVVTVYDMIHERFPLMFSQRDRTSRLKRASVLRADHVICISENTRRDLLDLVPVSPDKVSVVHLGFNQLSDIRQKALPGSSHIEGPFLLFVGERGHYKNFKGLLQAYASSNWLTNNFSIVCVGGGKLQGNELELMRELGISSWKVNQVNATDDMLAEYYKKAAAFIYPSRYEGFGLPSLEAMSSGCPVVCSNTGSMPEVVGNAGAYFDPESIDSIRETIEHVLESNEQRELLVQRGFNRSAEFSWERCATETLEIYRSLF